MVDQTWWAIRNDAEKKRLPFADGITKLYFSETESHNFYLD